MVLMLSPEAAAKIHERDAFILLRGLPQGAEVGVDGAAWAVDAGFEGFKMVPRGWHIITWNAASNGSHAPPGTAGLGGALVRRYDQHQLVLRTYDQASERFVHPDARPSSCPESDLVSRIPVEAELPAVIASLDHLKSMDPQLAPYPLARSRSWLTASSALHALSTDDQDRVVAAVLGTDPRSGDSWTDSLADLQLITRDGKDRSIPSRRPRSDTKLQQAEAQLEAQLARGRDSRRSEDDGMSEIAPCVPAQFADESVPAVRLPFFDARVSWPPGAVGSDLTRWSLDKTYALVRLACDVYTFVHHATSGSKPSLSSSQINTGKRYVLALFEVCFVLFACAKNSALLPYWSDLVTFFCRSPTILGAPGQFSHHPAQAASKPATAEADTADGLVLSPDLLLVAGFLQSLRGQLELLDASDLDDEESTALPGLREHIVDNLTMLRRNVARALAGSALDSTSRRVTGADQLVKQWRALSHLLQRKFSIDLDTQLDEEVEVGSSSKPPAWTEKLRALGLDPADLQDLEIDDDEGPAIVSQL